MRQRATPRRKERLRETWTEWMVKGEERWVESVGVVVVQGAEELVYIHREPPLLAREYRSIVPRSLSLSLSILQSVPTLSTTSLSLSLSVSNTHPSSTFSLYGSLSGPVSRAESACLLQLVWLRALLFLLRFPRRTEIGRNQEKVTWYSHAA